MGEKFVLCKHCQKKFKPRAYVRHMAAVKANKTRKKEKKSKSKR